MRKRIMVMLACMTLSFSIQPAWAKPEKLGLGINYSAVKIDNLSINSTVSMTKLCNLPLIVMNGGEKDIVVSMTPQTPLKVEPGYEAIPDPSWVVPEKEKLLVPAKSQASMDVLINIPNEKKYLNKKYHVTVLVGIAEDLEKRTGFNINLSMSGKLLFSIAPVPNQQALAQALENPLDSAYKFSQGRIDLFDVKPGEKISVKDRLGEALFLENNSSAKQTYMLYMKAPKETNYRIDSNTQTNMQPDDVKIAQDELTINGGAKAQVDLTIHIPKNVDLKKGKLLYVLASRTGGQQGVERQLFIYCSAETKAEYEKRMRPPKAFDPKKTLPKAAGKIIPTPIPEKK
ncbi:hypothetical protein JW933_10200 [candidate division FCPU426 bacterium]|nr:hypothetical protein [candidate division FCPU426 bacterium]